MSSTLQVNFLTKKLFLLNGITISGLLTVSLGSNINNSNPPSPGPSGSGPEVHRPPSSPNSQAEHFSLHESDEDDTSSEHSFDWTVIPGTTGPTMTSFPTLDMDLVGHGNPSSTPGGASTNFLGDDLSYQMLDMDLFGTTTNSGSSQVEQQQTPSGPLTPRPPLDPPPPVPEIEEPLENQVIKTQDSLPELEEIPITGKKQGDLESDDSYNNSDNDSDLPELEEIPLSVPVTFPMTQSQTVEAANSVETQSEAGTVSDSDHSDSPKSNAGNLAEAEALGLLGFGTSEPASKAKGPEIFRLTESAPINFDADNSSSANLVGVPVQSRSNDSMKSESSEASNKSSISDSESEDSGLEIVNDLEFQWGLMADRLQRARKEKFLRKIERKQQKLLERRQQASELASDSEDTNNFAPTSGITRYTINFHPQTPRIIPSAERNLRHNNIPLSQRARIMLTGGLAGAGSALLLTAAIMDSTFSDGMCSIQGHEYGAPHNSMGNYLRGGSHSVGERHFDEEIYTGHELDDDDEFDFDEDDVEVEISDHNHTDSDNNVSKPLVYKDIFDAIANEFHTVTKPMFFPVYRQTIGTNPFTTTSPKTSPKLSVTDIINRSPFFPQSNTLSLTGLRRVGNNILNRNSHTVRNARLSITPLIKMKNMLKLQRLKSSLAATPQTNLMPEGPPQSAPLDIQFNSDDFHKWIQHLKLNKSSPLSPLYTNSVLDDLNLPRLTSTTSTTTIPTSVQLLTKTIFDALYANISSSLTIMNKMQGICEDIDATRHNVLSLFEKKNMSSTSKSEELLQCERVKDDKTSEDIKSDTKPEEPQCKKLYRVNDLLNHFNSNRSQRILSEICPFTQTQSTKYGPVTGQFKDRLKRIESEYLKQIQKYYGNYSAKKSIQVPRIPVTNVKYLVKEALKEQIYSKEVLDRLEYGFADELIDETCPREDMACLWDRTSTNRSANSSGSSSWETPVRVHLSTVQQQENSSQQIQQADQHVRVYQQLIDDYVAKLHNLHGYPTCSKPKIQFPIMTETNEGEPKKPLAQMSMNRSHESRPSAASRAFGRFLLRSWFKQTAPTPKGQLLLDWKNLSSDAEEQVSLPRVQHDSHIKLYIQHLVDQKRLEAVRDTYIEFYRRFFQDQLRENVLVNLPAPQSQNQRRSMLKDKDNKTQSTDRNIPVSAPTGVDIPNKTTSTSTSTRSMMNSIINSKSRLIFSNKLKAAAGPGPASIWCQKVREVMYCPEFSPRKVQEEIKIAGLLTDLPEESETLHGIVSPVCSRIQEMCPMEKPSESNESTVSDSSDVDNKSKQLIQAQDSILTTTTALIAAGKDYRTRLQLLGDLAKEHIRAQSFPTVMRKRRMTPLPLSPMILEDNFQSQMEKPQILGTSSIDNDVLQKGVCNAPPSVTPNKSEISCGPPSKFDYFKHTIPSSPGGLSTASTKSGSSTPNASSSSVENTPMSSKSLSNSHHHWHHHHDLIGKTSKFPLLENSVSGYLTNGPPQALAPKVEEQKVVDKPKQSSQTSQSTLSEAILPYKPLNEMLDDFFKAQAQAEQQKAKEKRSNMFETKSTTPFETISHIDLNEKNREIFTEEDAKIDSDNNTDSINVRNADNKTDTQIEMKKKMNDYVALLRQLYGRPKTKNPAYVDRKKLPLLDWQKQLKEESSRNAVAQEILDSSNKSSSSSSSRFSGKNSSGVTSVSQQANGSIDLCPDECFTDLCPEECNKFNSENNSEKIDNHNIQEANISQVEEFVDLWTQLEKETEKLALRVGAAECNSQLEEGKSDSTACDLKKHDINKSSNVSHHGPLDLTDLDPFCRRIREVMYCPDTDEPEEVNEKPEFKPSSFEKHAVGGRLLTDVDEEDSEEESNLPVCKRIQELCDFYGNNKSVLSDHHIVNQMPSFKRSSTVPRKNFGGYLANPITGGYLTNGPIVVSGPDSTQLTQSQDLNKSLTMDSDPTASTTPSWLKSLNVSSGNTKSGFGTTYDSIDAGDDSTEQNIYKTLSKYYNPDINKLKNLNQKIPVYSTTAQKLPTKNYDFDQDSEQNLYKLFKEMFPRTVDIKKPIVTENLPKAESSHSNFRSRALSAEDDKKLWGTFSHIQPGMNPKWLRKPIPRTTVSDQILSSVHNKPNGNNLSERFSDLHQQTTTVSDQHSSVHNPNGNLPARFSELQQRIMKPNTNSFGQPASFTTTVGSTPPLKKFKLKLPDSDSNLDLESAEDLSHVTAVARQQKTVPIVDQRIPGVSTKWSSSSSLRTPTPSPSPSSFSDSFHIEPQAQSLRHIQPEPLLLSSTKRRNSISNNYIPQSSISLSHADAVQASVSAPRGQLTTTIFRKPHTSHEEEEEVDYDDDELDRHVEDMESHSDSKKASPAYYYVNDVDENGHYFWNEAKAKKDEKFYV